jgi:hypothetical protein
VGTGIDRQPRLWIPKIVVERSARNDVAAVAVDQQVQVMRLVGRDLREPRHDLVSAVFLYFPVSFAYTAGPIYDILVSLIWFPLSSGRGCRSIRRFQQ